MKLTDKPFPYPGVSTKHMLRSRTPSPKLLRLRETWGSSSSPHQSGYGLVLANISDIWAFESKPTLECLDLDILVLICFEGPIGSTWTICSQA